MNLILQLVALNFRECSFSSQFCVCKRGNDLRSVQDAGLVRAPSLPEVLLGVENGSRLKEAGEMPPVIRQNQL